VLFTEVMKYPYITFQDELRAARRVFFFRTMWYRTGEWGAYFQTRGK